MLTPALALLAAATMAQSATALGAPADGRDRPLSDYIGSYVATIHGNRSWWDIALVRGRLYLSDHDPSGTNCGIAERDIEGIRVVTTSFFEGYGDARAFDVDSFDWLTPEPGGLKDTSPQMGCKHCDVVTDFKKVSSQPNLDHMWYFDGKRHKQSCSPA